METVRGLGMRLVSWWAGWRPRGRPGAAFAAEPFTEARIRRAPAARGIYQLYRDGVLIYAGTAVSGIRRELERHRRGDYGESTRAAGAFHCEVAGDPEAALREYLRTYMASNGGRLPPGNRNDAGGE